MKLRILGCRGSTPATGSAFERFGGDTSSVSVAHAGEPPALVLDAGTGLRRIADDLGDEPFRGAILLTHLHWDHTHGLPFAPSVDRPDAEVDVFVPVQGVDPLELLSRGIGPPHFPITPAGLRGTWRFHALEPGRHEIAGFEVVADEVPHKGGRTFGYRVEAGGRAVAYIPDHAEASADVDPRALVADADLLLHDSQHVDAEWPDKAFLGHATIRYTVDLAARHGVRRVCLFHHAPGRTDDEIDAIVTGLRDHGDRIDAAAAGMRIEV